MKKILYLLLFCVFILTGCQNGDSANNRQKKFDYIIKTENSEVWVLEGNPIYWGGYATNLEKTQLTEKEYNSLKDDFEALKEVTIENKENYFLFEENFGEIIKAFEIDNKTQVLCVLNNNRLEYYKYDLNKGIAEFIFESGSLNVSEIMM